MNVKQTLDRLNIKPSKRRGQNFLIDRAVAASIAQFAALKPPHCVVEIGPGLGMLTGELVSLIGNVEPPSALCAVEIEEAFCRYLAGKYPSVGILNADVLSLTPAEISQRLGGEKFTVVSNVPYSISTELLFWLIDGRDSIGSASLLLQREYAERIAAGPGSRQYGITSVMRAMYARAELGAVVPGSAFHPRANVDSILLKLTFLPQPAAAVSDEKLFRRVVRAAFSQRRKVLRNSLASDADLAKRGDIGRMLEAAGIDPLRRAETLDLGEFAGLSNAFAEAGS